MDNSSEQLYFSPCFQCYTSAPFYKSILQELEWVASVIDNCHPPAREQVWAQLFAMTGANRNKCSKPFSAIVKGWTESSTLNLLAIELLYLSFAIALERNVNIFTENLPPSCKESLLVPKMISSELSLENIAQSIQSNETSLQQRLQNLKTDKSHQEVTYLGESSTSPKPRPLVASLGARLPSISSVERTEFSPQWSSTHTVNPYYHQPQTIPVTSNLSELQKCREKLSELYNCRSYLDNLPEPTKRRIWDSLALSSSFGSFTSLINYWTQDLLATNAQHITKLHSLVEFLQGGQEISSRDLGKTSPQQTTTIPTPITLQANTVISRGELFASPPQTPAVSLPKPKLHINGSSSNSPQTATDLPPTPCQNSYRHQPDNRMCIQFLNS